jgi:hypothetical protein
MTYAIKTEITDIDARSWTFPRQKTMYGGRRICAGDVIFVFASENEGGPGLIARGVVTAARAVPKRRNVARQTPRVTIEVKRVAAVKRRLGRAELRLFTDWDDGRPETELNFRLYRQATNKIVGLSDDAARLLARHCRDDLRQAPTMSSTRLFTLDGARRRDGAVARWFAAAPDPFGAIARRWFDVMRACGVDVLEVLHDGQPTACVGRVAFGYVAAYEDHVNVGFFNGASLPDASGLLEGKGRFMRHVKVRPGARIDEEALAGLIATAYADVKRLG